MAALKAVLEPAFRGATAAAAMLTVKDFMLLVCLALGEAGMAGGRACRACSPADMCAAPMGRPKPLSLRCPASALAALLMQTTAATRLWRCGRC